MKKGCAVLEFAILKDGKVGGMRFSSLSDDEQLDKAAWEGIAQSSPLPPLPALFQAKYLELRFHFFYNPQRPSISQHSQTGHSWVTTSIASADGTATPDPIFIPDPSFPQRALEARKQGTIFILLDVTKEGSVAHAEVTQGIDTDLDQASLQTLKTWKFLPIRQDGKPVETNLSVRVSFHLQ